LAQNRPVRRETGHMLQELPPAEVTEAQICRARKMEVVGQLAGGIVHDFNNILTVISGTIDILAEAVADRPELAAVARLIDQAAARGADLTAHLLALARDQPSRPRDVDVNLLLVDAARLLRPTLGEQFEIASMLAGDAPLALVDPNQLMTAVLDLAISARDAMPEGGKLTFVTGNAAPDDDDARAPGRIAAGDHVLMAIRACGHGISAGPPERIFSGLGMVRNFIAQSSGHIVVRGEAGHGIRVEIYLPRSTAAAPAIPEPCLRTGGSNVTRGDE
jgi:signal transduction histidine kinase